MAISNSSVEIGKNVIKLLQNISNNAYGNISNISNSSHHIHNDKDDSFNLEPYYPLIGAGVAISFYICVFSFYKLCILDCDFGKCCKQSFKDFMDALSDCFFCFKPCFKHCFKPCFTKIKNISLCISDICLDYWCPLQQESDIYSNLEVIEDPNYLQIYMESLKENENKPKKIIKFEEKSLITSDTVEICSICLEIIDNNKLVATPCNHYFCQECIQEYLNSNNNDDCPNCRQKINNTLYKDLPV